MMTEMESKIKNYLIISEYGKNVGSEKVILVPIDFESVPKASELDFFDGVVRLNPDNSVYRIQVGKRIYSNQKEIMQMSKILGLHNENKGNWDFSNKMYDFETEGFNA